MMYNELIAENMPMDDHLLEKLQVAKDYLQNIVGYSRVNNVMEPIFDVISEEYKQQAMVVVKAYYRGESIEILPLSW